MVKANELRNKTSLSNIPDQPGYYKWYAERSELDRLLDKLSVNYADIQNYLEVEGGLYCIYVGIAVKESLRKRLNWHINDPHTESRVKNGTLSTLRQSIASLIAANQYDARATNDFIDKLRVEYFPSTNPIGSQEAQVEIHTIERNAMKDHLYILNIQENKHIKAGPIKKDLRLLEKKQRAIKYIKK